MSRKDNIKQLLTNYSRRLQKLKEQEALYGPSITPGVLIEIEDLEAKIEDLQADIEETNRISEIATPLSSSEEAFNQRNRTRLLEKIETFWIKRVLEGSLRGTMLLELGLEYKPGSVDRPWDMILQYADQVGRISLPRDQKFIDVFDQLGGKLLILGEPGSGKTITLLELARDLIARAKQNRTMPIPVVFNLSSWTEARKPITAWLVDELNDKYQVPQKIGQYWVDSDQLVLLLDGLDEVRQEFRTECVEAINYFTKEHDGVKIVVCSRSVDYETLTIHLRLDDAVALQPLTPTQIDDYLSNAGEHLAELLKLLQKNSILQELAQSPLLLSIMAIVYRGLPADAVLTFNSTNEWTKHLLDVYVTRMFERRGVHNRYTRKQTLHWLNWLAGKMSTHSQSLFLIEKMQPDWLPTNQHLLYSIGIRLIIGMLTGVIFGLAVGTATTLVFGLNFGLIAGITFGVAWGLGAWLTFERAFNRWGILAVGIAFGLAWGVACQMAFGVVEALVFGSIGILVGSLGFGFGVRRVQDIRSIGTPNKIVIVEILTWSWAKARSSLLLWVLLALPIGFGIGAIAWLAAGSIVGWAYGTATTLSFMLTFGLAGGLTSGEIETKTMPNQGIWRSRRNANLIGGIFGAIMTVVFGLSYGIAFGPISGLAGVTVGLAGWLVGWLIFGGITCTQHLLLRIILFSNKCIPWNYARFLDYAAERIFLRKVGGGYIFIHHILLDYFAASE